MKRDTLRNASARSLFLKGDFAFLLILGFAASLGFLLLPQGQTIQASTPAGGSITGTVRFAGPVPHQPVADAAAFGMCGKTHSYDRLILGRDKGVEYTLIYIANPPAGRANFPPVTITQQGCGYTPHMAIATRGSTVTFANDDPGLHNVHGYYVSGSERETLFNFAQPSKGMRSAQQLRKPGMVNVQCDVHAWMNAWIWVTDNPYVAVTKSDGSYSIDGLPPGTYKLIMWHEGWHPEASNGGRPQFSGPVVQTQEVTVPAAGSATADFELK